MDPDETLRLIAVALDDRDSGLDIDSCVEDLLYWLSRGGFEPDWSKYPTAHSYVKTRLAMYKRFAKVTIKGRVCDGR